MRIAQISPLFEAVPPKLYGGTERVVYSLTEELVAMGHDVTLFASGDSITSATLAPMRERALRLDPTVKDWVATYYRMVEIDLPPQRRVRCAALPYRLFPAGAVQPSESAVPDDDPRPARSAGIRGNLRRPSRIARSCRSPTASAVRSPT